MKNEKIKEIIREYLKHKDLYDSNIIRSIHTLNKEIQMQSEEFIDLADAVLPSSPDVPPSRTNNRIDASFAVLERYEKLKKDARENEIEILNNKLDFLEFLTDLKKMYSDISFIIMTLEPKKSLSVGIYMDGGKISEIANELNCSYNTASNYLNNSIQFIEECLDDDLKNKIAGKYDNYRNKIAA